MSDLISRKEIIDRLERVIQNGVPSEDGMHPISAETVLEVVKELSALSTNLASLGTDCISRQAAIDICDNVIDLFRGQFGAGVLVAIKESIEELPSAQPEPLKIDLSGYSKEDWERFRKEWANIPMTVLPDQRTGKWIQIISIPNDMYGRYYCSECGKEGNPFWYFCPNCGADMRGEEDDT